MDAKDLIGVLAIVSFTAILFTPINSNIWIYFGILGVVFGIGWVKK